MQLLRQNQESFRGLKHYRPYCFIHRPNENSEITGIELSKPRGIGLGARCVGVILAIAVLAGGLASRTAIAQNSTTTSTISVDDAKRKAREAFAQKDYAQAVGWLRKAADQGDADAEYGVGLSYHDGLGGGAIPRDYAQALVWFRKSADQGFARAQNDLGAMYQNAQGVTQDYQQAMTWYRKAADQGYGIAQLNVGLLYENGLGVTRDREQAIAWYSKAADQGNADARARLAQLQVSASPPSGTITMTCHNVKGNTAVIVDTAAKSVRVDSGRVITYQDGKDQYVTITADSIEFGCRHQKKDSDLFGEMAEHMLGPDDPKKDAELSEGYICLMKNRIDRRTGVWTAVNAGEMLAGHSDSAICSTATKTKF
jgi:TPR repeat protein